MNGAGFLFCTGEAVSVLCLQWQSCWPACLWGAPPLYLQALCSPFWVLSKVLSSPSPFCLGNQRPGLHTPLALWGVSLPTTPLSGLRLTSRGPDSCSCLVLHSQAFCTLSFPPSSLQLSFQGWALTPSCLPVCLFPFSQSVLSAVFVPATFQQSQLWSSPPIHTLLFVLVTSKGPL